MFLPFLLFSSSPWNQNHCKDTHRKTVSTKASFHSLWIINYIWVEQNTHNIQEAHKRSNKAMELIFKRARGLNCIGSCVLDQKRTELVFKHQLVVVIWIVSRVQMNCTRATDVYLTGMQEPSNLKTQCLKNLSFMLSNVCNFSNYQQNFSQTRVTVCLLYLSYIHMSLLSIELLVWCWRICYLATYSFSSSFAWTSLESRLRYTSRSRSTLLFSMFKAAHNCLRENKV